MSDMKQEFRQIFNELATKGYLVQDIIPETATFLFLLESPHVQELKYGAPVSGSSGASMTKHLYGDQYEKYPLGILIKKNRDEELHRPSLDKVALMNVCQIPMQGVAYKEDPQLRAQYGDFFKILEGVRAANNKTTYPNQAWNIVQEIIVDSLRRKLNQLVSRQLVVVPCGRFAQKFYRLAGVNSDHWLVIDGVPHPSYNGWSKSEYARAVERLKQEFSQPQGIGKG